LGHPDIKPKQWGRDVFFALSIPKKLRRLKKISREKFRQFFFRTGNSLP